MFLVSSCSCLGWIHQSQVLSREWTCSWSSADRRCSNYIWVINNFIAFSCAQKNIFVSRQKATSYSGKDLLQNRLQAITWTKYNSVHWSMYNSPGLNESIFVADTEYINCTFQVTLYTVFYLTFYTLTLLIALYLYHLVLSNLYLCMLFLMNKMCDLVNLHCWGWHQRADKGGSFDGYCLRKVADKD